MNISALILVAVALAVVGCGFSFVDYSQSTQIITYTNAQSFTTSSVFTTTSFSTAPPSITRNSNTIPVLTNDKISIRASDQSCYYDWDRHSMDAGPAQISFSVTGGQINFWMFTQSQFDQFSRTSLCKNLGGYLSSVLELDGSTGYTGSVQVPTVGVYYFVFLNWNSYPVSIILTVTENSSTQVTVTPIIPLYATATTIVPTQKVDITPAPVGLGPLFYLGLTSVAVAIIILAYDRKTRHK